jgi:hypothetical protein
LAILEDKAKKQIKEKTDPYESDEALFPFTEEQD